MMEMSPSAINGKVIGLYGLPGSGKSYLLYQLKGRLNHEEFAFYEGSEVITSVTPGGAMAFQQASEQEKTLIRQRAINTIRKESIKNNKTGLFMFWPVEQEDGLTVATQDDLETFTRLVYLNTSPEEIARRYENDKIINRPLLLVTHMSKWHQAEEDQLRNLCRKHNILFISLPSFPAPLESTVKSIRDFHEQDPDYNDFQAEKRLDDIFNRPQSQLETVLVLDADKCLAAEDPGLLFWETVCEMKGSKGRERTLQTLFSSPLSYSYTAFR